MLVLVVSVVTLVDVLVSEVDVLLLVDSLSLLVDVLDDERDNEEELESVVTL